jgi:hypothetical protein
LARLRGFAPGEDGYVSGGPDEAISDFLKKNNRPVTLKAALKQSASKPADGKRRQKSH